MTFDLHIHSRFSDGQLTPETARIYLSKHYDYRTVTDHDNADFHRKSSNFCSFTGMEISSYAIVNGEKLFAEFLFYGFEKEHPITLKLEEKPFLEMSLLTELVEPLRKEGALLFLAHPMFTFRRREPRPIMEYMSSFIDGFECLHRSNNLKETLTLLDYCKEKGLFVTGGSDSHLTPLHTTPNLYLTEEYADLFSWIPKMASRK